MVHKKYAYRNGKRYGPYLYENKRVNGKVVTTYLGAHHESERRRKTDLSLVFILAGLIFVFGVLFILSEQFNLGVLLSPAEPFSISLSQSTFEPGQAVVGELKLQLSKGELIPADARIVSNFDGVEKSFSLSELAGDKYSVSEGNFYLENSEISGFGSGYGLIGLKETFPEVSFQIKITKPAETDVGTGGGGGATEIPGEIPAETPAEVPTKTPEGIPAEQPGEISVETPEEVVPAENPATPGETVSGTGGDTSSESSASDTSSSSDSGSSDSGGSSEGSSAGSESAGDSGGEPSLSPEEIIIDGAAAKEKPFDYGMEAGWKAEIVSGSVKIDGEAVDDGIVKLEENEESLVVSTDYSVSEEGFGQEFLGDEVFEMTFNLDKFEFTAPEENSALDLRVEYGGQILFETSEDVLSSLVEEIVTEDNKTIELPTVNETFGNETNATQPQIVLGEPVVWTKRVDAVGPTTVTVELPNSATVLSVEGIKETVPDVVEEIPEITQEQIVEPKIISKEAISEGVGLEKVKPVEQTETAGDLMLSPPEIEIKEVSVEIAVGENGANIVYETPAPEIVFEEVSENKKKLIISGPDNPVYTNVLAFTELPESFGVVSADEIRIRWVEENSFVPVKEILDKDENGIADYVEWIVPHLSNQTFEIILITKAEHLDENRTFVEDVYDFVKAKDDNWTTIPERNYLRVTFEQNLTSEKDITIYARSSANATVEVYEKNGTELIADFGVVNENKEYKILLTNLVEEKDTFDLKILGGDVEFDYVVDPTLRDDTTPPSIEFVSPTPQDGSTQPANSIYVNVSSTDEGDHYTFVDFDRSNVLWMRMDDVNASGDPTDFSSYSNNGTSGYPGQVNEGYFGKGFNFSNGAYVTTRGLFSYFEDMSISVWAYPQASAYDMRLVSQAGMCNAGEFSLSRTASGNIKFSRTYTRRKDGTVTVDSWTTSAVITPSSWSHITLIYDINRNAAIYVNGVVEFPTRQTTSMSICESVPNTRQIGRGFIGTLDEVLFFNRNLSSSEVLSLYNASAKRYENEFSSLNLGEHTVTGFAVDKAGLKSQTETRQIFVSNEFIPYIKLNSPNNASEFDEGTSQINLDADVYDPNNDLIDVLVYGVPETDSSNFYNYLLDKKEKVANGTKINYNFVSVPVNPNSAGLVGLWHFDNRSEKGESEDSVFDWSGNGNSLSRVGNVEYNSSGKFGYSADFNDEEVLYAPDSPSLSGLSAVTVSAWVKVQGWQDSCVWYSPQDYCYNYIVAKSRFSDGENEYRIRYENGTAGSKIVTWFVSKDGNEEGYNGVNSSIISISIDKISPGTWHLLIGTWHNNTGEMKFYLDGNLENSTIFNAPKLYDGTTNFSIGAPSFNEFTFPSERSVDNFNGSIDEVAVWNRALSETEVKDLYRLKAGKYFWKVNVTDEFGNNNESETREFNITGPMQITGCGELNKTNKVYELQGDLGPVSGNCFNITADGVTLDGKGFTIFGDGLGDDYAVFTSSKNNLIVKNLNSNKFNIGIYFNYTNFSKIENTYSKENTRNSIYLDSSFYNSVRDNTARDNKNPGIRLERSSHNLIENNSVFNNTDTTNGNGIRLLFGTNNTISRNIVLNNSQQGIYLSYGTNNTISRNIVLNNSQQGIYLSHETNDKVADNTIAANYIGLYLDSSSGCNVSNAVILNSFLDGLYLDSSSNNIFSDVFSGYSVSRSGAYFVSSANNSFSNINLESNFGWGIYFSASSNNSLYSAAINGSKNDAIYFSDALSQGNILSDVSVRNTISSKMDVYFAVSSINGTQFIDSSIGNYSFAGIGGVVVFKNSQFGEIKFLQPINGTGTNLSNDVRIGNNSAIVLSNVNAGLNKSANVTLYGIGNRGFSVPKILRDGAICPAGICYNFTSLTAENVTFNVTGWTEYKVGEDYIQITTCPYTLNQANRKYVLMNDIGPVVDATCLSVVADNVTLDGQRFRIFGNNNPFAWPNGPAGINVGSVRNTKIFNLNVSNFNDGIRFVGSNYSLMENVSSYDNLYLGIYFVGGMGNIVQKTETKNGGASAIGFGINGGKNNNFDGLNSRFDRVGGYVYGASSNNTIKNSIFTGFASTGVTFSGSGTNDNILENVTFSGSVRNLEVLLDANKTLISDSNVGNYSFGDVVVYFKNSQFGEIRFLQPISGSGTNLSRDVRLASNLVEVRSDLNVGLNKSANVTMPFNYPLKGNNEELTIYRDYSYICNATTIPSCYNFTSLKAENVSFNVSSWTTYSIGGIVNSPPYAVLHSPQNEEIFTEGILGIELNATVYDFDNNTIDVSVYGVPETGSSNFYNYLLHREEKVNNGTRIVYNWTSPVVTPDSSTILLMHFDRRNEFGENDTFVRDFSGNGNNGTISGNAVQNVSGGKLAGAFEFGRTSQGIIVVNDNPDFDINTGLTISAWIKPITSGKYVLDHNQDYRWLLTAGQNLRFTTTNATGSSNCNSDALSSINTWYFVSTTYNGTVKNVYINGVLNVSCPSSGNLRQSNANFAIGDISGGSINYFNGTIDEVAVWNRALNDSEIKDLYRLKAGAYLWKINVTDRKEYNESEQKRFTIATGSLANVVLNSTYGTNRTDEDLYCNFATLYSFNLINVTFYEQSVLRYASIKPVIGRILVSEKLSAANTTKNQNWTCKVKVCEIGSGTVCSEIVQSNNLTILNSPPIVSLDSPANNATVTDRTPTFNWTIYDADNDGQYNPAGSVNDTLVSELNLSCYDERMGTACLDNRYASGLANNYTISPELLHLIEDEYYYNWSVGVSDGVVNSSWTGKRRINIASLIDIVLHNSPMQFGTMSPGDSKNTTTDNPLPFVLENNGTDFVNVSINASVFWLSPGYQGTNESYQFKVDWNGTELDSFNYSTSATGQWFNMPIGEDMTTRIADLNYADETDTARVDIKIAVPPSEPPGDRNSTITFWARRSKGR